LIFLPISIKKNSRNKRKEERRKKNKKMMHISLAKVYLGSKDEWLRPYLIDKVFFIVIKLDLRIDPAKG
jgi:hypothetical protein